MTDYGHEMTEYELSKLEKKISGVYSDAKKDLDKTITEYFEKFAKLDEEKKQLVADGEMSEQAYKNWRLNAMGRGKRYEAMRDKVAQRITDADVVARSYVEDKTPGIYSLNRNYTAYTIEKAGANVDFTLFDESTVRRLIVEDPETMPYYSPAKALDRGIDLEYGKKQITKTVTSSILQGKSIPKIADDLQTRIVDMSRTSSVRAARTAITSAENAGRVDTYKAAEDMGIELEQEWLATLDGRTRHSHRMVDGERVKVGGTFSNGCRFPGDPNGPPWEVYNCRCTLIAALKKYPRREAQRRARNAETGKNEVIGDLTYSEWVKVKQKQASAPGVEMFTKTYGIPADFAKGMSEAIAKSSFDDVKAIFVKYQDELRCNDSAYKGGAVFRAKPWDGPAGIYFNAAKDAVGSSSKGKTPYETVFHEFGHNIDYILGGRRPIMYISETAKKNGMSLIETIKSDYKVFRATKGVKSHKAFVDAMKAENLPLNVRRNISDVIEGITGISYPLGVGHGAKYHKRPGATEREFFAEVLSASVTNPGSLEQMQRLFPNAVQMVFDIIGGNSK